MHLLSCGPWESVCRQVLSGDCFATDLWLQLADAMIETLPCSQTSPSHHVEPIWVVQADNLACLSIMGQPNHWCLSYPFPHSTTRPWLPRAGLA